MDSLDQKAVQPSRNRSIIAVFAVVVIALAAYVFYAQMQRTTTEEPFPGSKPVVTENFEKRIARVGWKEAGYASQAEVDQALAIRKKKGEDITTDDLKVIRDIVDRPATHADGVSMLRSLKHSKDQFPFYEMLKGYYGEGTPNTDLRKVISAWARNADRATIDKMMKDPDKSFATFVTQTVQQIDDPRGNMAQ